MKISEKIRITENLKKLLIELSDYLIDDSNIDALSDITSRLSEIYKDGYRHLYSDLCDVVDEISVDESEHDIDCLIYNLFVIIDFASSNEECNCAVHIEKLYDHICLEAKRATARLADSAMISAQREQINNLSEQIQHLTSIQTETEKNTKKTAEHTSILEKQIKRASSKLKRTQTDIIAVLSIFSAIVLTFSGGLSYISSALSSVNNAPLFKSVLFILVCGFVMFNTVVVLMYITGRMIDVNIFAHLDGEHGVKLSRYVFWVNLSIVIIAAVDIIAWIFVYYHNPDLYEILNSYFATSAEHNITQTNFNT